MQNHRAFHLSLPSEKSENEKSWGIGEPPPKDRQGRTKPKGEGKGVGSFDGLLGENEGSSTRHPHHTSHNCLWLSLWQSHTATQAPREWRTKKSHSNDIGDGGGQSFWAGLAVRDIDGYRHSSGAIHHPSPSGSSRPSDSEIGSGQKNGA